MFPLQRMCLRRRIAGGTQNSRQDHGLQLAAHRKENFEIDAVRERDLSSEGKVLSNLLADMIESRNAPEATANQDLISNQ